VRVAVFVVNLIGRRNFLKSILLEVTHFMCCNQPNLLEMKIKLKLVSVALTSLSESEPFLKQKNLGNQYDWTALAGASLLDFPSRWCDRLRDQLDLSYRLHHIYKVIILDHQDQGLCKHYWVVQKILAFPSGEHWLDSESIPTRNSCRLFESSY